MDKLDIAKNFNKQKEISKRGLASQWENTETCWQFYNGNQMTYSDNIQFADTWGRRRRAMVEFNKVQPNVDGVVGFMAQNRRQAKYIARLPKKQHQVNYSRRMNALSNFHRSNMNADQLETLQDLDMMVNGYGAIDTDLSYIVGNSTVMPHGEILARKIDPLCVYWDISAKGPNLLDAQWVGYWQDYDLKDALSLFEGSKEEDFEITSEEEPGNLGYIFNPYGGIYSKIKMDNTVEWSSRESELVRVYNHQWFEYETFYEIENPVYTASTPMDAMFYKVKLDFIKSEIKLPGDSLSGDVFDFDPLAPVLTCDEATKRRVVKEFGKLVEPIPFKRRAYYTAIISGKHVFSWFRNICQRGFSIKFKTGTWNYNLQMFMGMVNPMIEPQKYHNKALTELMFTIASNSKGGVMIEEDAVEDIADFEGKWAKTDAVIVVSPGTLAAGKIQEKTRGALPTGLENIITLADANISANGVDPSFLGQIDREDQAGILYKRRIKQVIAKMARYMDSITLYQKEWARLLADLNRVWVQNNEGAVVLLTGEDGVEDYIRVSEDMLAPDYDVTIQEASQSSDEKQETAQLLSAFADKLLVSGDVATGKAFLSEAIQYLRLDGDVQARLTNILQPKEQQVDPTAFMLMQQQLQQLQQYIQSGEVEKTQSETQKNLATAAKTLKDAQLSEAQLPKVQAETVKTLEESRRTAMEVQQGSKANQVSINI